MSTEDQNDKIFKALGHRRRREILDSLKDNPQTTGALCEKFADIDRCTVMQHLSVLEGADLIIVRREGRERWNHLNPLPIRDLHARWIGPYAAYAVEQLARLKAGIEAP
jgi:DNA-binding transcriptional ArsR family regulator